MAITPLLNPTDFPLLFETSDLFEEVRQNPEPFIPELEKLTKKDFSPYPSDLKEQFFRLFQETLSPEPILCFDQTTHKIFKFPRYLAIYHSSFFDTINKSNCRIVQSCSKRKTIQAVIDFMSKTEDERHTFLCATRSVHQVWNISRLASIWKVRELLNQCQYWLMMKGALEYVLPQTLTPYVLTHPGDYYFRDSVITYLKADYSTATYEVDCDYDLFTVANVPVTSLGNLSQEEAFRFTLLRQV